MSQKYQNEKSPIVYGIKNTGKSPKNDCVTSLRNLQDVCEHPVDYPRAHILYKTDICKKDEIFSRLIIYEMNDVHSRKL